MAFSSDGGSIYLRASSSTELVKQLRKMSHTPSTVSVAAFMARFADHFKAVRGGVILRTDTPENFISDLILVDYIKISPQ